MEMQHNERIARELTIGDLIIAGVDQDAPDFLNRVITLPPSLVLEERARRREIGLDLVTELAHGFVPDRRLVELSVTQPITNYHQCMAAVAQTLTKQMVQKDIPAVVKARVNEYSAEQMRKRLALVTAAGERALAFKKNTLHPDLRPLANHATRQEVDLLFLSRPHTTERSSPLFVAAKVSKLLDLSGEEDSLIDKTSRVVASRSDPLLPVVTAEMLKNIGVYDNQGLKVAYMTRAEAYRNSGMIQGGRSTMIEPASGFSNERQFRDYFVLNRTKRTYEALHHLVQLREPYRAKYNLPDPIEIQLFAADGILIEFFDPKAGHFTHQDQKIERQELQEKENGEWRRQLNVLLTPKQKALYERLREQIYESYAK